MALFSFQLGTKRDAAAKKALKSWNWNLPKSMSKASAPRDSWASPGNINNVRRPVSNQAAQARAAIQAMNAQAAARDRAAAQQAAQLRALQAQIAAQQAEARRQAAIQAQLNRLNAGLQALGLPPVPSYPTKPLPIPAVKLQEWAEKRAAAARAVREAMAHQQLESGNINDRFNLFLGDLRRQVERDQEAAWDEAVSRNLALSPIFINPLLRQIREDESAAKASALQEKTHALRALEQMVANAKRTESEIIASTDREKARIRSELDRLVRL